ncbi:MAG TPA: heme-binding domain-containing protein [Puia sp.]|nr:heme-binding domain-containing protein [Puia sp.]
MVKKILLGLLAIFVIIQFFRPQKNQSTDLSANDITRHTTVPDSVLAILKKSCYDCHSNNTVYPWYNNIQPVAWWLANHVNEGRRHLNYSEFASYAPTKQYKKMLETVKQLKEDEMPLNSYLWIHRYAILDSGQKTLLISWADSLGKGIKAANNLPDQPEEREQRH